MKRLDFVQVGENEIVVYRGRKRVGKIVPKLKYVYADEDVLVPVTAFLASAARR